MQDDHLLYQPDVAHCDFYLFIKVKLELKGTGFESVESVKAKAADTLNNLTEEDFQQCFAKWKIQIEGCMDCEGEYIVCDKVYDVISIK